MRIIVIIIIFLIFIVGIFWYTLSAKVNQVSDKEIYSKMLNIQVFSLKEMILAKNFPPFKIKELNVIGENKHLDNRVEKITILPINTEINFSKAFEHIGGTSGQTTIVLVGEVTVNKKVYKMEYLMHPEIYDFNIDKNSKEFAQKNADYFNQVFSRKQKIDNYNMRTKTCDICKIEAPLMYRIQIQKGKIWTFVCKDCCVKSQALEHYKYGGTWKG